MRHSKSRFIEEARRVGTGAVANRTYRGAKVSSWVLGFTVLIYEKGVIEMPRSIMVEMASVLSVQPNLRNVKCQLCTCRPAGA